MSEKPAKAAADPALAQTLQTDPNLGSGLEPTHVAKARAPAPSRAELGPGAGLGRYVILERLATGGMGEVYAAWDPNLDRKVALKILRTDLLEGDDLSHGRTRLLREAQAMARLSHPNIVTVHDVGSSDGEVFIAMEFLDGSSLREHLAEKQPPWEQVLSLLLEAGKGLAAAHHAGIVHRDFKPHNVIVTRTGRVCVLDFGIARSPDASAAAVTHLEPSPASAQPLGLLTQAGSLVGTPGYMSPQQYKGEPVDARTDQFSFCVALYEGLYGRRPYQGDTLEELTRAACSGVVPQPPEGCRVPEWVLAILRRGLAVDPNARYPRFDDLLTALSASPLVHRKRKVRRLTAVGLVIGALVVAAGALALAPEPCPAPVRKWERVWDPDQRLRVEAAFLVSERPYARASFYEVDRLVSVYRQAWFEEHQRACQATRVQHEQSEELLDRRMVCLNQRLDELRAVTRVFEGADAELVTHAVQAMSSLAPVSGCSAERVLANTTRPPDPKISHQVATQKLALVQASALVEAGKHKEAAAALEKLRPEIAAVGYGPLVAEHALLAARLAEKGGQSSAAVALVHDAAIAAEAWNDTEQLVRAWTTATRLEAFDRARHDAAQLFGRYAEAALARTSRPPALEGELESTLGLLQRESARYDESIAHYQRSLELLTAAFGESHPRVGFALHDLGWTESWAGDQDRAVEHSRAALKLLTASYGPDHPEVAKVLTELGSIEDERSEFEQAVLHLEQGLKIRQAVFGPDHFDVAMTRNLVALTYARVDRIEDAAREAELALEYLERNHPGSRKAGHVAHTLGEIRLAQQRNAEALALFEEALRVLDAFQLPPDSLMPAYPLTGIGEAQVRLGRHRAAIEALEKALRLREGRETLAVENGKTRSALARALKATGADPARINALATQARADFVSAGRRAKAELAILDAAFP